MQMMLDAQKKQEIILKVQAALDKHQPRNYRISVDPDGVYEEQEWIHVVVVAENDQRDRDFYDALAEAENDIETDDSPHYLLVPAIAD